MTNAVDSGRNRLLSANDVRRCCCSCRPGNDIYCGFDLFSLISIFFLLIGLALITIGYAIPCDYKFDPHKPARLMEAIEIEYVRKRFELNVCIMVGTGFVTLSGLIIAFIVSWELCTDEDLTNSTPEVEPLGKPPSYGSVCGNERTAQDATVAEASTSTTELESVSGAGR